MWGLWAAQAPCHMLSMPTYFAAAMSAAMAFCAQSSGRLGRSSGGCSAGSSGALKERKCVSRVVELCMHLNHVQTQSNFDFPLNPIALAGCC